MTEPVELLALAAAIALLVVRIWRRGWEARSAIGVGVLTALAVVTRTGALAFVPLVAIGALGPFWTRGAVSRKYFGWLGQAAAAAGVVVLVRLATRN